MPEIYDVCFAKCPFFLSSGRKNIRCEGVTDESAITLSFSSEDARNNFRRTYCNTDYEECALCKMLLAKYED